VGKCPTFFLYRGNATPRCCIASDLRRPSPLPPAVPSAHIAVKLLSVSGGCPPIPMAENVTCTDCQQRNSLIFACIDMFRLRAYEEIGFALRCFIAIAIDDPMTGSITISLGALKHSSACIFLELIVEFSRTGKIVPAGVDSCAVDNSEAELPSQRVSSSSRRPNLTIADAQAPRVAPGFFPRLLH
jgi:hypothetical protein